MDISFSLWVIIQCYLTISLFRLSQFWSLRVSSRAALKNLHHCVRVCFTRTRSKRLQVTASSVASYFPNPRTWLLEKASLSSRRWENWIPTCRRMKWAPYLTPHTNSTSTRVKDFMARPETIAVPQESGRSASALALETTFWMRYQKHRRQKRKQTREMTSKLETSAQQRRQSMAWKG